MRLIAKLDCFESFIAFEKLVVLKRRGRAVLIDSPMSRRVSCGLRPGAFGRKVPPERRAGRATCATSELISPLRYHHKVTRCLATPLLHLTNCITRQLALKQLILTPLSPPARSVAHLVKDCAQVEASGTRKLLPNQHALHFTIDRACRD
jgi:hypothetical protein